MVLIFSLPPKCQQNKESSYLTAVHQGLSKYLTAQDTHISPTSIKTSLLRRLPAQTLPDEAPPIMEVAKNVKLRNFVAWGMP